MGTKTKTCENQDCKNEFEPKYPNQRYCCGRCQVMGKRKAKKKINQRYKEKDPGRLKEQWRDARERYIERYPDRARLCRKECDRNKVGSGTIGPHRREDVEEEMLKVHREVNRIARLQHKRTYPKTVYDRPIYEGELL